MDEGAVDYHKQEQKLKWRPGCEFGSVRLKLQQRVSLSQHRNYEPKMTIWKNRIQTWNLALNGDELGHW
jgi:hypothetical protein